MTSLLLKSWVAGGLCISVHRTPCIVTQPPVVERSRRRVLVNSGNEALVGTQFPYFPMPQAPPAGLQSTTWGGMEAGNGMYYRTQVVDGIVSQMGGKELRGLLMALPEVSPGIRCPVGEAVVTVGPMGTLSKHYDAIVHTAAPLFDKGGHTQRDEEMLLSCFDKSITAGFGTQAGAQVLTMPLIGAGSRGAQPQLAAALAARVVGNFAEQHHGGESLIQFVCLDPQVASLLVESLDEQLGRL